MAFRCHATLSSAVLLLIWSQCHLTGFFCCFVNCKYDLTEVHFPYFHMPSSPGFNVVPVSSQDLINELEFSSSCRSRAIKYVEFHKFLQMFRLPNPLKSLVIDKKLFCSPYDLRISGMDALEPFPLFKTLTGLEVPSRERCHNE